MKNPNLNSDGSKAWRPFKLDRALHNFGEKTDWQAWIITDDGHHVLIQMSYNLSKERATEVLGQMVGYELIQQMEAI